MHLPFTNLSIPSERGLFGLLQEGGQTLSTFVIAGLMLFGVVAFSYTTLGPHGWLQSFIVQLWAKHPNAALIATLVLVIFGAAGKRVLDRTTFNERIANGLTYACLACGIYFTAKLAMTGAI